MNIRNSIASPVECFLDTAALELKTTAANMANIDTPGYKTRGVDFNNQLIMALTSNPNQGLASNLKETDVSPFVDGLISRPDGNNVSMDREGMKMAEAQLKFRMGVALIKQDFAQISEAIHSDSK